MDKSRQKKIYEFEDYRLDAGNLLLYRGTEEVSLTPKAIETLLALIERHGEIVTKDELMEKIWTDAIVEESNLSQYLHILRKTLGNRADGKPYIETLRRRGYRFSGEVSVTENGAERLTPNIAANKPKEHAESSAPGELFDAERKFEPPQLNIARSKRKAFFNKNLVPIGLVILAAAISAAVFILLLKSPTASSPAAKNEMSVVSLTNGEVIQMAAISPDGKYFVYHTRDEEGETARLRLQQVGQASGIEIIPPFDGTIYGKTFTPDSKFIYFLGKNKNDSDMSLYLTPTLGGSLSKLFEKISTPVSFSPDGREMVFSRFDERTGESSLIIAASDGANARTIQTKSGVERILYSAWSPSRKEIAFVLNEDKNQGQNVRTIKIFDLQSGQTRDLSDEKWEACYRMAWTRDGKGFVFVGTRPGEVLTTRRDQIYYVSLETGESRRLTNGVARYDSESLSLTNADEILALPYNRLSQIWSVDAVGDALSAVRLTNGQADGRGGIASLPDGQIGYTSLMGENFGIWIMNHDGTQRRQLAANPTNAEELRAAPNGCCFFFSSKNETRETHLFRIDANGANLKQITFGDGIEIDSAVSPDGKWLVYDSTEKNDANAVALWKISIDGGEPFKLSDTKCQTPHFSPDGKSFSCISGENTINVLSAENGALIKTFKATLFPMLNVGARWSPDGKYLTYIAVHKNVGNIRRQPVAGGEPQPLTNFTSGDIYNYSFSNDGAKLYLARGYQNRDAVLIKNFR